jgi:hypothetical protein
MQLQALGFFDDPEARQALLAQPVRHWDRRTRNLVADFTGQQELERLGDRPIAALEPDDRRAIEGYLASQGQFIDEGRVQQFLLHQRLSDLPDETRQAALVSIGQEQVARFRPRRVDNLPLDARETALAYMEAAGIRGRWAGRGAARRAGAAAGPGPVAGGRTRTGRPAGGDARAGGGPAES